jgi:hypothetical protein
MNDNKRLPQPIQSARYSLVFVIILTLVNIVLYLLKSNITFTLSAFIPYFAVITGNDLFVSTGSSIYLLGCYLIAITALSIYIFAWFASRSRYGWFIGILVFYILDTVFMVYKRPNLQPTDLMIDLILHGFVIYTLFKASLFYLQEKKRLKALHLLKGK